MSLVWTEAQRSRLVELGVHARDLDQSFVDNVERDKCFQNLSRQLAAEQRERLATLREAHRRPSLRVLETNMISALTDAGFVEVFTPIITSKGLLEKMSVTSSNPLHKQIFWIDENRCLRPMLAPHLYYVMKDLLRLWPKPVRIFEVGPCFRKESSGARHASEFTMLNLCEFGLPEDEREPRLRALSELVMTTAAIADYRIEPKQSTVYGSTLDVLDAKTGLELASGAMGPHDLDKAWGIADAWVGVGFGLERILMSVSGGQNLARYGRSISYLDGVRLNL